jgi:hypothetical protein
MLLRSTAILDLDKAPTNLHASSYFGGEWLTVLF